ncbi:MAG: DUF4345 domain-containing protein [Sandaracinaceae bacterium]|nr:DUF4345 domain-containing protein [Sandaracinaceae bacterium]
MSPLTRSRLGTATLALAGIIGIAVGAAALFAPDVFFASNGIQLGANASLRSELRSAGGANLGMGVLMLAGAFARPLRLLSALLVATFYLAYGTSRVFAWVVDGPPHEGLIAAAIIELAIGAAGVLLLARARHARHP